MAVKAEQPKRLPLLGALLGYPAGLIGLAVLGGLAVVVLGEVAVMVMVQTQLDTALVVVAP